MTISNRGPQISFGYDCYADFGIAIDVAIYLLCIFELAIHKVVKRDLKKELKGVARPDLKIELRGKAGKQLFVQEPTQLEAQKKEDRTSRFRFSQCVALRTPEGWHLAYDRPRCRRRSRQIQMDASRDIVRHIPLAATLCLRCHAYGYRAQRSIRCACR